MFNLQGSEIIFILLLALVVLGPEKLPGAIRRFTRTYAELKKMSSGFQSELKSALDEPVREMRETADLVKRSADPGRLFDEEEAAAAAAAERDRASRSPGAGDPPPDADGSLPDADTEESVDPPVDPFADPVDDPLEPDEAAPPEASRDPDEGHDTNGATVDHGDSHHDGGDERGEGVA